MTSIGPQHGPQKSTPNRPQSLCWRGFPSFAPLSAAYFFIGPQYGHVLEVAISKHFFPSTALLGVAQRRPA